MQKAWVTIFALIGLIISGCSTDNEANVQQTFQQGQHYEQVQTATKDTEKKQLVEFFWYGCPHCQEFEPMLQKWREERQELDVDYVPVIWDQTTRLHAQVFYLLHQQDDFEQWHRLMFYTISQFSRTDGYEEQKAKISQVLIENGLPGEQVKQTVDGWLFAEEVNNAMSQAKYYGVSAVPTVVVNQRYKVLNHSLASVSDILLVVDFLLAK